MFCPRTGFVMCCKIETNYVLFKSTTFYLGGSTIDRETVGVKIFKDVDNGNDFT